MMSLSMKTYPALFCGIFTLLFLGVRSENDFNATIAPVSSLQTPAEVTSPRTVSPLNSTDKTRNASEKPFAHSVSASGTERPTHNETPSIMTTASEKRVNVTEETKSQEEKSTVLPKTEARTSPVKTTTPTAPALISGQQPAANNSTMTTMLYTTAKAPTSPALTTSFTPITNNSMSTVLPQNSSEGTTTSPKETTSSATTAEHLQNITNKEFNESTATTEDPASSVNATTGSVLENAKNFSATPESPVENQSTTRARFRTTAFSNNLTTTAEIPSTNASISVATNATQGGGIPVITKILSTSTATTTKVTEPVQNTEAQPCSSIVLAKRCLIAIASLAVVATIFTVSTIVLCTKLSSRKYKLRRQQQGTEMMCISSLMPERSSHRRIRYTRQRSPVPNGVLVIPNGDDSDDDNLTLSSFLPENDRYV